MNTRDQPEKQDRDALLEQLSKPELVALVKQMLQLYPDLEQLIDSKEFTSSDQQHIPFDPELYRLKVTEIFYTTDRNTWGSEGRAAGPLLDIMDIADGSFQKQDYANAAMIYDIIIRETLNNYASFRWHAYEGDLDDMIEQCVDGLEKCLQKEQRNTTLRTQIIQALRDVYAFDMDLDNDEPVMSEKIPTILVRRTTPTERKTLAEWARKTFELNIDWKSDDFSDLWSLLRGSPCRVYSSDMKVFISETRYFHPDVIVTCDPRDRGTVQAIQSPRLVVEVLSPSTELTDRTWKLQNYRAHPTIEEYVLIDAKALKIEIYHKENNKWIYDLFENGEEISLNSLGVHFPLLDAYADVEFENTAEER